MGELINLSAIQWLERFGINCSRLYARITPENCTVNQQVRDKCKKCENLGKTERQLIKEVEDVSDEELEEVFNNRKELTSINRGRKYKKQNKGYYPGDSNSNKELEREAKDMAESKGDFDLDGKSIIPESEGKDESEQAHVEGESLGKEFEDDSNEETENSEKDSIENSSNESSNKGNGEIVCKICKVPLLPEEFKVFSSTGERSSKCIYCESQYDDNLDEDLEIAKKIAVQALKRITPSYHKRMRNELLERWGVENESSTENYSEKENENNEHTNEDNQEDDSNIYPYIDKSNEAVCATCRQSVLMEEFKISSKIGKRVKRCIYCEMRYADHENEDLKEAKKKVVEVLQYKKPSTHKYARDKLLEEKEEILAYEPKTTVEEPVEELVEKENDKTQKSKEIDLGEIEQLDKKLVISYLRLLPDVNDSTPDIHMSRNSFLIEEIVVNMLNLRKYTHVDLYYDPTHRLIGLKFLTLKGRSYLHELKNIEGFLGFYSYILSQQIYMLTKNIELSFPSKQIDKCTLIMDLNDKIPYPK